MMKNYKNRKNEKGVTFAPCQEITISSILLRHQRNQSRKVTYIQHHLNDIQAHIAAEDLNVPIVVEKDDNGTILLQSGHHRLEACRKLADAGKRTGKIPAYIATFESEKARVDFLQRENAHPPAQPHTIEDAVKYLETLRSIGEFSNLTSEQEDEKAKKALTEHYSHFTHGKTLNKIIQQWRKGNGTISYRVYTDKERATFASKHHFYQKSGKYDRAKQCYYINADLGNAKKMSAFINSYDTPDDDCVGQITMFVNTKGKTEATIKARKQKFIEEIKAANKRWLYKVKEIYFLPDLVSDLTCDIHKI
jgi:hypothetical protein